MGDVLGVPVWLIVLPPLVALIAVIVWLAVPSLRRNLGLRIALILSVGIAGIEAMIIILVIVMLALFSASGGTEAL